MAIDYDVVNGKNKKKLQDAEQVLAHDPALTGMRPVLDPLAQSQTYLAGSRGETAKPTAAQETAALKSGPKTETPVTPPVTPPTTGDKGGGNGFNASEYLANYPTYYSPTAGASYSYSGALPTYSFNQALPTYSFNQATPGDFQWDRERPADFTYDKERPADFAYDAVRPEYTSAYQDQINAMVDQILNRDKFSYDYTQDPLYQQYAEAYTRNGKQAMNDTHAQIAARTGGLASSYAGTAAQQQYNQYMQALNDKIPELYQLAYSMYNDEGNTMRNNLSMVQGLENTDYGRYMDQLGQYNTDRNFAYDVWQGQQNQYENDRNLAYNQWLANQNQYENDRNFAYNQYNDAWDRYYNDRNFTYGQYQDALGQWNTDRNFTYGQYVDALGQYNTDRNFDYNVWSDNLARQETAARNAYNAQVAAYNSAYGNKSGSSGGSSESQNSGWNDPYSELQLAGIRTKEQAMSYLMDVRGYDRNTAATIAEGYYSSLSSNTPTPISTTEQQAIAKKMAMDDADQYDYGVWTTNGNYEYMGKTYKDKDSLFNAIGSANVSPQNTLDTLNQMLRTGVINTKEYNELLGIKATGKSGANR